MHIAARNTQLWISCTSRKRQNIVKGLKKYSTFTRQIEQQTIGRKFMFPSKLSLLTFLPASFSLLSISNFHDPRPEKTR